MKSIAVALVVILSVEMIPVAAVDEIRDILEQISIQDSLLLENDAESGVDAETPGAVCEIVSMRQANVKYFLMSDGTYTAAQYGVPVHYKDENNHWQDIDNTLEYVDTEEYKGYRNKENDFDVKFSATNRESSLVEISKDSYSLSWKYLPSVNSALNTTTGSVSSVSASCELENAFAVETVSGEFKYRNIEDDIDLDYAVTGSQVKENIIIKQPQDKYVFRMLLFVRNLNGILREDGSIDFLTQDTDVCIFHIPSPYMFDAEGNYSEAVQYTLNSTIGGYVLTITADRSWINAQERSFPVTVDPIVNVNMVNTTYTSIASADPYNDVQFISNGGNNNKIGIVGLQHNYGTVQSIWKLQLPIIPDNTS